MSEWQDFLLPWRWSDWLTACDIYFFFQGGALSLSSLFSLLQGEISVFFFEALNIPSCLLRRGMIDLKKMSSTLSISLSQTPFVFFPVERGERSCFAANGGVSEEITWDVRGIRNERKLWATTATYVRVCQGETEEGGGYRIKASTSIVTEDSGVILWQVPVGLPPK